MRPRLGLNFFWGFLQISLAFFEWLGEAIIVFFGIQLTDRPMVVQPFGRCRSLAFCCQSISEQRREMEDGGTKLLQWLMIWWWFIIIYMIYMVYHVISVIWFIHKIVNYMVLHGYAWYYHMTLYCRWDDNPEAAIICRLGEYQQVVDQQSIRIYSELRLGVFFFCENKLL